MACPDPALLKARNLFKASGKSLDEVGAVIGAEDAAACKAAWQVLNKVSNPRIGTLWLFAKVLGVPVEELVGERKDE